MKIIAFGHRKRAGKDTAARFLATELRLAFPGITIKRAGFADKVKDVAYQIYGWAGLKEGWYYDEPEQAPEREVILSKLGKTPRQLWIGVGNGIRSACGYDGTWFDYLIQTCKADVLICCDLRFPAEADGILALGGWIYRVDSPRSPIVTDGADERLADYDRWTSIVDNSGDMKQLHAHMVTIMNKHFK